MPIRSPRRRPLALLASIVLTIGATSAALGSSPLVELISDDASYYLALDVELARSTETGRVLMASSELLSLDVVERRLGSEFHDRTRSAVLFGSFSGGGFFGLGYAVALEGDYASIRTETLETMRAQSEASSRQHNGVEITSWPVRPGRVTGYGPDRVEHEMTLEEAGLEGMMGTVQAAFVSPEVLLVADDPAAIERMIDRYLQESPPADRGDVILSAGLEATESTVVDLFESIVSESLRKIHVELRDVEGIAAIDLRLDADSAVRARQVAAVLSGIVALDSLAGETEGLGLTERGLDVSAETVQLRIDTSPEALERWFENQGGD